MTQKLALYFLSQNSASRVLDAEHQPLRNGVNGWTIGRLPACDIAWSVARNPNYGMVSKRHAMITAAKMKDTTEGGTPLYRWELTDHGDSGQGSTNGTYLSEAGGKPYRIQPGVGYLLSEGDRIQFGCSDATVKCSFDIDETSGPLPDTDPATGMNAETHGTSKKESTGRTLADVAVFVLTGPDDVDKRLWWVFCGVMAIAIAWILEK